MRITNRIMTNNSLANINRNKVNLTKLEEQYNTGKKIQRPSDDPIIAVRALKLRNNLTELNQYYEKNIPDAKSWMEVTESALNQVNSLLTSMHTLCDQGSQDTLNAEDRNSILQTLIQYKDQIYQEGNSTYAGRYIFTGFKTDTPLAYLEDDNSTQFKITESLSFVKDVVTTEKLVNAYTDDAFEAGGDNDFSTPPELKEVHRIRLAYDKLDAPTDEFMPVITYIDEDGEEQQIDLNFESSDATDSDDTLFVSTNKDAYLPEEGRANFIAGTGEIVLSNEVYDALMKSKSINVSYYKSEFAKNDLMPQHYFNCTATKYNTDHTELTDEVIEYVKEDQQIQYEVSFNQKLTINTQGSDSITHAIGREVGDIEEAIGRVKPIENYLASVEKKLAVAEDEEDIKALNDLKKQLTLQLDLANSKIQKTFEKALDFITGVQETMNIAVADMGSRMVRLNLTEDRLSTQQNEFEELLSNNEDADLVDTIVRFNSQEVIYNASLKATSQVVQNTLMDFIR